MSTPPGNFKRDDPSFATRPQKSLDLDLIVHINEDGVRAQHGARSASRIGKRAHRSHENRRRSNRRFDKYGFDAAFGGARRDEEKSRAKERDFLIPQ